MSGLNILRSEFVFLSYACGSGIFLILVSFWYITNIFEGIQSEILNLKL